MRVCVCCLMIGDGAGEREKERERVDTEEEAEDTVYRKLNRANRRKRNHRMKRELVGINGENFKNTSGEMMLILNRKR